MLKAGYYKQLIAEAEHEVQAISADDAKELFGDDSVVFVDVRDIREIWRDGRVPNAFHAPRGMLEFWIDPESPYHKPVFATEKRLVFYCALDWRATLAAQTAKRMGVENCLHLSGGFKAWKSAGGSVEQVNPRET